MTRKRVGEVLQERGNLSSAQIDALLEEQNKTPARFGELVLERGLADKMSIASAIEQVSRMKYIDCVNTTCEKKVLESVPYHVAMRLTALPIRIEQSQIVVAMAEPQKVSAVDELRFLTGRDISTRLSFRPEIIPAIKQHYGSYEDALAGIMEAEQESETAVIAPAVGESIDEMEYASTSSRQGNREAFQELAAELMHKKAPAVRLVSTILTEAIRRHATDIHIEPQAREALVGIRAEGMVTNLESVPNHLQNALISRIKILSDMDISERRAPQEGGFIAKLGERCVKMRVSTLPTQYGEKVLMHLLNSGAPPTHRPQPGFARHMVEQITQLLSAPGGMLLVTGPTGYGKSPSLYSMLHMLRKPVRHAQLWRSARHVALLLHYFSESTL